MLWLSNLVWPRPIILWFNQLLVQSIRVLFQYTCGTPYLSNSYFACTCHLPTLTMWHINHDAGRHHIGHSTICISTSISRMGKAFSCGASYYSRLSPLIYSPKLAGQPKTERHSKHNILPKTHKRVSSVIQHNCRLFIISILIAYDQTHHVTY